MNSNEPFNRKAKFAISLNCINGRTGMPCENWAFGSFCESTASLAGKFQPEFEGTCMEYLFFWGIPEYF
jgi:hypothetical protein